MADERLVSRLLERWEEAREQGETLSVADLCASHPHLREVVQRQIDVLKGFDAALSLEGTLQVEPPAFLNSAPSPLPHVSGYELLDVLGRGGMGVVYQARQVKLDRLVALKMILSGSHAGPEELVRFRSEAEAVARLQHPNIVQIHEIGEHDGLPYFSLEFVDGGSLAQRLGGTPWPARPAAHLVATLARAVYYAHQRGVIHRDLKPGNILLVNGGGVRGEGARDSTHHSTTHHSPLTTHQPKITDFGLAKRLDADKGRTQTGAVLGTPSYMAPEQAAGRGSEVGPAADTYALGAILYELLTGRPPFRAESAWDTIAQVITTDPVPPRQLQPNVPRDLETICLRCLRKKPHARYASAEALADDLHRFLNGEPIEARPTPAWERAWKWAWRRPATAVALASSVLLLLGAVAATLVYLEQRVRRAEQEARVLAEFLDRQARVESALRQGRQLLAEERWKDAELAFTEVKATAGTDSRLTAQVDRAERLLADLHAYQQARDRLVEFQRCRDEALFYGSEFTGQGLSANLKATRDATRKGLDLFAVSDEGDTALDVGQAFSNAESQEIRKGVYELLLLRAEAVARPLSGEEDAHQQARQALRILDRAQRLLGQSTRAYHLQRGLCLARLGDEQAATAERKLADSPGLEAIAALDHFLMGKLLLTAESTRRQDVARAIGHFESALQVQPGHFWAQFFLASAQLRSGRPDLAKAHLIACLNRKPDFPWIYILKGFVHSELGEFDAAEIDFRKADSLRPGPDADYILRVNRGAMHFRQGKLAEAAAELEQAACQKPDEIMAHVNLAQVYQKQEKFAEAAREFDTAIRLQPSLAPLYRSRARLHLERKDLPAALRDFEDAIRLSSMQDPALAADHTDRGRILHHEKRQAEALEAYNAALVVVPDHAPALHWKGELLLELKRYPEALAALDAYLRKAKPTVEALRARGLVRAHLGDYAGAIDDYSRALDLKPAAKTGAELHAQRAWTYVISNQPKIAANDFEEAIRLDPENGDAFNGRGLVRARLGQERLAVADAEQALRLGPRTPRSVFNAARIYALAAGQPGVDRRLGYRTRAVDLIRQALALVPESERAPFWEDVVASDSALASLRGTEDYDRLAASYRRSTR